MQDTLIDKDALKEELRLMQRHNFLYKMMKEFTEDTDTSRMEVALEVLAERSTPGEIPGQLAWGLWEAVGDGNIKMAALLLKNGAPVDGAASIYTEGVTLPAKIVPLEMAVNNGQEEMVTFLLQQGASVEVLDNLANVMSQVPRSGAVPRMIEAGMKAGANGALLHATINEQFDVAELLISKAGANINSMDGLIVQDAAQQYDLDPTPDNLRKAAFVWKHGGNYGAVADFLEGLGDEELKSVVRQARKLAAEFTQEAQDVRDSQVRNLATAIRAFGKGAGNEIIAPEKAAFKQRTRVLAHQV